MDQILKQAGSNIDEVWKLRRRLNRLSTNSGDHSRNFEKAGAEILKCCNYHEELPYLRKAQDQEKSFPYRDQDDQVQLRIHPGARDSQIVGAVLAGEKVRADLLKKPSEDLKSDPS